MLRHEVKPFASSAGEGSPAPAGAGWFFGLAGAVQVDRAKLRLDLLAQAAGPCKSNRQE